MENNANFEENRSRNRTKWKDVVSFWIFGLCNNYGYVVMLTAAVDIIQANSVKVRYTKGQQSAIISFHFICR
jgi:battenin